MKKIYDIDFAALSGVKKSEFIYAFQKMAQESFADDPFEVTINAQLLIFTRWWNSYCLMAPDNPAPKILDIIMEKLWDYQQGTVEQSDFVHFANCVDAVSIEIATGHTEKMNEDEAYYDFKAEHFWNWDGSYDLFLINVSYIFYEISEHEIDQNGVSEMLDSDIADLKVPFFEDMDDEPNCTAVVQERRFQEIYSTPTFCQVIALLQKDMRTALEGKPMAELREIYQNEYLFSPEECARVTDDWL